MGKIAVELILYRIENKTYTNFWFDFDIEHTKLKISVHIDQT